MFVECGGIRAGVQVFRRKFYAHIHLNYVRVEFYLVLKKKKKCLFREEDVSFPTHLGHLILS